MQPVQITICDLPKSPAIHDHLVKKAQKLNQFYQRINTCHIVISIPQKHKHNGKLYCVHIDISVPGKELVASHKMNQDVYVAIRDAFKALTRQLESYADIRRGEVKSHELGSRGIVKRMFVEEGYGFIESADGHEHYFSTANVAFPTFDQLKSGDTVFFISQPANDGWQAHKITKEKSNHFVEVPE